MAGRGLPRRTTLVAWDVDNIRPRPGQFGSSVKSVLCAPQVTLVGGSTDVVLAANTRTLSQIVPDREEIDELIRWGLAEGLRVEVIETEQRRQAVDRGAHAANHRLCRFKPFGGAVPVRRFERL